MQWMKKDMGGAAHALGLSLFNYVSAITRNLRVLIPAVENAISDCAYRPGDIIRAAKD